MLRTRQWWQITLASVGDAVMATDTQARIVFLNPAAEQLTGWTLAEAEGRSIGDVFVILNEQTRQPAENPALRALTEGRIQGLANHTILIARDGVERGIDDSAAPIRDDEGTILGVVLVFRDVTEKRKEDRLRAARLAVAQILSRGTAAAERPALALIEAVPKALDWSAGSYYVLDREQQVLLRRGVWAPVESGLRELLESDPASHVARGVGLVGRAWQESRVAWLRESDAADLVPSTNLVSEAGGRQAAPLPRDAPSAVLRSGLACPITIDGEIDSVIALWRTTPTPPDPDLADTMTTLAAQIGDFIHRRRVQAEIRRREAELDDFFVNAVVGLHWVDADGVILRANRAELAMLGYSEEEYVGHSLAEFYVDRDESAATLARLRRGEEVRDHEVRLRAKDGSIRHVIVDSNGFWDEGRFVHSRCFTRDVTDRRNAEVTLRFLHQASQTLAGLVDYRTTLERIAQLAVPEFADWCTVQIATPKGIELVAWTHRDPTRSDLVRQAFERHPADLDADYGVPMVIRTGRSELIAVITDDMLVRAARTESHLRLLRELQLSSSMTVPLASKQGVRGSLRFVAAESGRRYTRADLETAKDLAAQASIAIDNALLYEEVRDADRRKDEFLATLSHELRNPLAPIRSGIDLLALDPGSTHGTVELMRRQIEHLVRLADDLLDLSRITHGKVELRREAVQLSDVVESAVSALRRTAESKDHALVVELPAEPIWLDADPVRLLQVLENLLNNAVKYTEPGGRIEVAVESQDGSAAVRIRDNGIGIAPDLMAEIFEPFTQASSAIDRAHGGLGIGLTLVRLFTEMHGGTVSASSAGQGRGSEFVVRLPLGEIPELAARVKQEVNVSGPDGRLVLVVDDNSAAASMLALLLGRLGAARVEVAGDGLAAVTKAAELRPDLILLDIGLPGMDGYQVARELRARRDLDSAVLVALTGYGQEQDRLRSREAGFDEHLVKPASVDDLKRVLGMTRS